MQLFHDTKPNQLPPYLPPMPLLLTAAPHLIMLLPPSLPPSLQLPSALPPSVIGTAHTDDGAASNGGGRVFDGGSGRRNCAGGNDDQPSMPSVKRKLGSAVGSKAHRSEYMMDMDAMFSGM